MFSRRYTIQLEGSPESARRARRFFATVARRTHLDPEQISRGEIAVSELVTNAVTHARGPIRLSARPGKPCLRVEVSDGDPRSPHMDDPSAETDSGRGLPLVAAMVDEWGWDSEPDEHGKRVWFNLSAHRA